MQAFVYHIPTRVIFGQGTEAQTAEQIRLAGAKRVFLVYGGGSAKRSGLIDRILADLAREGIACMTLGGVQANPRLGLARQGVQQAVEFGADLILAVGGGSVIDTAKAIAHGAACPGTDIWEFWLGRQKVTASLPVGVVLTISAAGSETSDSAVLTDESTGTKRGLSTPFNRPLFAILDPELTYTLPRYQIACGIVDIMMHTMDRYFTPAKGNQLTDAFAEALLRTVIANGPAALANSKDYQAMSELMWCGSVSHNGLTGLGAAVDFTPHKLGHELSGRFDVAHGASLSAIWGHWARYCLHQDPARFARFGRQVWNVTEPDDQKAAEQAIQCTVDFFRSLDMPTCFSELGIGVQPEEVLYQMADKATRGDTFLLGSFLPLNREKALEIYRRANC